MVIAPLNARASDENWITLNLYDSFFPMTEERSFPENLNSIEIMFNNYHKRQIRLQIEEFFLKKNPHGLRSREGHYIVWVHLSDRFLANHHIDRAAIGEHVFLFNGKSSDILTGWSGSVNLAALLREGIKGMARPIIRDGRPLGGLNSPEEISRLGDADYEAGWFLSDAQAETILRSIANYHGRQVGYAFLGLGSERPNPPHDPPNAQLVNGYNCTDFAFYLLTEAGVITRDEAESLKIRLWYPEKYFDTALPLSRLGQKGKEWLERNPAATSIPDSVIAELGWADLLFGRYGVEFFYKQRLFSETWRGELRYRAARVWDMANVISWMRRRAQFSAKGITTEILPAVRAGTPFTEPYRRIRESRDNRFILSDEGLDYKARGLALEERKLKRNGIVGEMKAHFRRHLDRYKVMNQ